MSKVWFPPNLGSLAVCVEAQQFLSVYVDDMKLAGPSHLMEAACAKLGEGSGLEKPEGNVEDSAIKKMTFLGCEQRLVEKVIDTDQGKKAVKGIE